MREEGLTYNPNVGNDILNNSGFSSQNIPSSKRAKPSYRICFLANNGEDNPLISTCKCNGSMKNIHYLCLKKCIETKIIKKTEHIIIIQIIIIIATDKIKRDIFFF